MRMQEESRFLPEVNRLSVLTSVIMLAYAVMPFVTFITRDISLRVAGVEFVFRLNFSTIISILTAVMAAAGMNWLLESHPYFSRKSSWQHWILPALTAWVIGVPLRTLSVGLQWWAVFTFGGLLLVLVFLAEYIVVDLLDVRHTIASLGLTTISFALYLVVSIAVRAADWRVYLLAPALAIPMFLVSMRALYLRLEGRWCVAWSVGITLFVSQLAIALHYWPIAPLTFGLLILGPAYALTNFAMAVEEGHSWRTVWIEPVVMLFLIWGLALLSSGWFRT